MSQERNRINVSVVLLSVLLTVFFGVVSCSDDEKSGWEDQKSFDAAKAAYDAGNYDEAQQAFDAFITEFSDSPLLSEAEYYRALTYYQLADYSTANTLLAAISSAQPAGQFASVAFYYQGKCAYKQNDFDSAARILSEYLQQNPDTVLKDDATYYMGRCYFELKEHEKALLQFETVLSFENSAYVDSALYWSGRTAYQSAIADLANIDTSKLAAAKEYFQQVLADFSGAGYEDNASFYLALCDYRLKSFDAAILGFTTFQSNFASSIYADNAAYYIGSSQYSLGKYADAIEAYNSYILAYPETGYVDNAVYFIGRSYYQIALSGSGAEFGDAISMFEQLINTYPESNYVDNAFYYEIRAQIHNSDCTAANTSMMRFEATVPSSDYLAKATAAISKGC